MRIISLCPSLTELVFDLGRGSDLVGITDYCVHPADRVARIETVGGTKTPKVDRIVELAPDIVLFNSEENRREDAESLIEAGLKCLSSMPRDAEETAEMCRSIGRAIDREAEGEQIAREILARTARVKAAARGCSPVRWAYIIWRKPWMSVNSDTFAHTLLAQAGGVNVFGDMETRYPEITIPDLAAAEPDVVFLCTEPYAFEDKHIVELAELTGLSRSRFQIADGEYLSWHGSRTPDGIDYAESLIESARG